MDGWMDGCMDGWIDGLSDSLHEPNETTSTYLADEIRKYRPTHGTRNSIRFHKRLMCVKTNGPIRQELATPSTSDTNKRAAENRIERNRDSFWVSTAR
eukprot:scaffold227327_cov44-Prasinocladus_malaysianus.AAC.1